MANLNVDMSLVMDVVMSGKKDKMSGVVKCIEEIKEQLSETNERKRGTSLNLSEGNDNSPRLKEMASGIDDELSGVNDSMRSAIDTISVPDDNIPETAIRVSEIEGWQPRGDTVSADVGENVRPKSTGDDCHRDIGDVTSYVSVSSAPTESNCSVSRDQDRHVDRSGDLPGITTGRPRSFLDVASEYCRRDAPDASGPTAKPIKPRTRRQKIPWYSREFELKNLQSHSGQDPEYFQRVQQIAARNPGYKIPCYIDGQDGAWNPAGVGNPGVWNSSVGVPAGVVDRPYDFQEPNMIRPRLGYPIGVSGESHPLSPTQLFNHSPSAAATAITATSATAAAAAADLADGGGGGNAWNYPNDIPMPAGDKIQERRFIPGPHLSGKKTIVKGCMQPCCYPPPLPPLPPLPLVQPPTVPHADFQLYPSNRLGCGPVYRPLLEPTGGQPPRSLPGQLQESLSPPEPEPMKFKLIIYCSNINSIARLKRG